jgi:hypothetical protein
MSLIDVAIFRYFLFALTKALHNRRSLWCQRSLIREPLRKISVILSDDIQRSCLGQLTMVLGKNWCMAVSCSSVMDRTLAVRLELYSSAP